MIASPLKIGGTRNGIGVIDRKRDVASVLIATFPVAVRRRRMAPGTGAHPGLLDPKMCPHEVRAGTIAYCQNFTLKAAR
jgi:hypothetical protein